MQPVHLDNTHYMAKSNRPGYPDIPIFRDAAKDHMTSIWHPTDEELADLIAGGCVAIRVAGGQPLPMQVTTVRIDEELLQKEDTDIGDS